MDEIQRKDNKEISKYLKIICGKTMQALLDSYMFMFPAAYKYDNKDRLMVRVPLRSRLTILGER